jgi:microcystin-dependent protein
MAFTRVPNELIKNINPSQINSAGATNGQVLTYNSSAGTWVPTNPFVGSTLPAGSAGQVLTYNGTAWVSAPVLPTATNGQILSYNGSTNAWAAVSPTFIPRPATASKGEVLGYDGSSWVGTTVSAGSRLPTGLAGQILMYDGTSWIAANNLDAVPIGSINYFAAQTPPTGYLECNGAVVSQSTYAELFQAIGTRYNTGGEGTGNFRLPDLRGEFVRGWDNGRGIDAGRTLGSKQEDEFKSHSHTLDKVLSWPRGDRTAITEQNQSGGPEDYNGYTANTGSAGGTETRPRNVALMPCIKALRTTTATTNTFNFIEKPSGATHGQVLTYNGNTASWFAGAATGGSSLPVGQAGQVLVHNGITWAAADSNSTYTIIGNARAGIFADAVCFVATSPGSGLWKVPTGVTSIRVTCVGAGSNWIYYDNYPGGGGAWCTVTLLVTPGAVLPYSVGAFPGGATRFNYTTGTAPAANSNGIYAGGASTLTGGTAAWNGVSFAGGGYVNDQTYGITGGGYGGAGGEAAGGVGGGGGGGFGGGGWGRAATGNGGGGGGLFSGQGSIADSSYYVSYGGGEGHGGSSGNTLSYTSGAGGGRVPLSYKASILISGRTFGQGSTSADGAGGLIVIEW